MDAYFEYGKDFESTKNLGVVLSTRPKIKKATRRNTNIVVNGRNGDLLNSDNSYNNVSMELTCNLKSNNLNDVQNDIDTFYNFLDVGSYTPMSFFFDKEHYYSVAFQGDFEFENTRKTGLITTINVKFTAKPFKYLRDVPLITKTSTSFEINNTYNRTSWPIITVYGSGNLTLTINGEIYKLANIVDNLVIDSELYTCYRKIGNTAQSAEQNILNYTFPSLKPGTNKFAITVDSGSFDKIEIQPRWVV